MIGGAGNDQAFGQAGNDRLIWNPGEGSDRNEGGSSSDTVEVIGGNGAENFTISANGKRVRFEALREQLQRLATPRESGDLVGTAVVCEEMQEPAETKADGEGFEPPVAFRLRQFSRLLP